MVRLVGRFVPEKKVIWHFRIPRKSKKVKKKDHLKKDGLFLLTRKIEIAIIPNINERTKAFLFGG